MFDFSQFFETDGYFELVSLWHVSRRLLELSWILRMTLASILLGVAGGVAVFAKVDSNAKRRRRNQILVQHLVYYAVSFGVGLNWFLTFYVAQSMARDRMFNTIVGGFLAISAYQWEMLVAQWSPPPYTVYSLLSECWNSILTNLWF